MKKIFFFVLFIVFSVWIVIAACINIHQKETIETRLRENNYYHVAVNVEQKVIDILERIKKEEGLKKYEKEFAQTCEKMCMWSELYMGEMSSPPHWPMEMVDALLARKEESQQVLCLTNEEIGDPLGDKKYSYDESVELRRYFWMGAFKRRERIRYLMNRLEACGWEVRSYRKCLARILDRSWFCWEEKYYYVDEYSYLKYCSDRNNSTCSGKWKRE